MSDHAFNPDYDEDDLEPGRGTVLDITDANVRRGGTVHEPARVVDLADVRPAPSLEDVTSDPAPTLAAGLFALAGAVDRLASAVEKRKGTP